MIIKELVKRILYPLLGLSVPNQIPNVYKTTMFNFMAFGFNGILHFPIIIYGNTKIYKVGKIRLKCRMRRGLVKIGELDYKSHGETKFFNYGTIDIYGPVKIEGCSIIENTGSIIFMGNNRIADGCTLIIRSGLTIGKESRIGFHSMLMDSDDHYTINVANKVVGKNTLPIVLGAFNWIANSTIIKKGVKTPDYLIVASANALLTKDYTNDVPKYSVIGGAPAKLLKTGIRRIFNTQHEREIRDYFDKNPTSKTMSLDIDEDKIEDYCKLNGLNL